MGSLEELMETILVPANESQEKLKNEELWIKIRDLIRLTTKNSDYYYQKYMKIKFNSDDELLLNNAVEISTITMLLELFFLKITNIIHKFFRWCMSVSNINEK